MITLNEECGRHCRIDMSDIFNQVTGVRRHTETRFPSEFATRFQLSDCSLSACTGYTEIACRNGRHSPPQGVRKFPSLMYEMGDTRPRGGMMRAVSWE